MGEVTFLDVSKRFTLRVDGEVHHVQALDRVSFTVKDGEIVALIGPVRLRQDHGPARRYGARSVERRSGHRGWARSRPAAVMIVAWCSSTQNCCPGSRPCRT